MTREQAPALGTTVAGKYLLEAVLGQGGMGAVYRARHLLTGRKVALKWMFTDVDGGTANVQRFLREARAMGLIDHPSVIGVHDVGLEGEAAFLVMELLRGSSLRDHMLAGACVSAEHAIALMMPALEGVAAAHLAGVVHRDLKPENLFVVAVEDGKPAGTKVLDFGISKLREDPNDPTTALQTHSLTRTGAVIGTPSYMAPEQIRGSRDLDGRTDIWALGAILYELLSGELPFEAETIGGLMIAIATELPARLELRVPTLPVALADAVHRALDKSLDTRWQDIEGLARALEPFAPGVRYHPPRPSSVRPPALDARFSEPGQFAPILTPPPVGRVSGDSRLATAPAPKQVEAPDGASTGPYAQAREGAAATPATAPVSLGSATKAARSSRTWAWAAIVIVALGALALGAIATSRDSPTNAPETLAPPTVPTPRTEQHPAPRAAAIVEPAAPPAPNPTSGADSAEPLTPSGVSLPSVDPVAAAPVRGRARGAARHSDTTPTTAIPTPATGNPSGHGRTGALSREEF